MFCPKEDEENQGSLWIASPWLTNQFHWFKHIFVWRGPEDYNPTEVYWKLHASLGRGSFTTCCYNPRHDVFVEERVQWRKRMSRLWHQPFAYSWLGGHKKYTSENQQFEPKNWIKLVICRYFSFSQKAIFRFQPLVFGGGIKKCYLRIHLFWIFWKRTTV